MVDDPDCTAGRGNWDRGLSPTGRLCRDPIGDPGFGVCSPQELAQAWQALRGSRPVLARLSLSGL